MTLATTKYADVLKEKQELEARLEALNAKVEELEAAQEHAKVTVEGTGNGVLLGFKTDKEERREIFLTAEEVSELIYALVVNTPNLEVVVDPFKREWDSIISKFFL